MRRVWIIVALCSLLAVPLYAADIYWDQSPSAEPTVTDKDFTYTYGDFKRAKSLGQMDVYDSGERLRLDDEVEAGTQAAVPAPARSRDVIDLPQRAPATVTRPAAPIRRNRATIQPAQQEVAPSQVEPTVHPQAPAPTVRPDDAQGEPRRPIPVPAIAEEPAKTEPKKLPWGRTDLKPNNGPSTEFQWGKRPK